MLGLSREARRDTLFRARGVAQTMAYSSRSTHSTRRCVLALLWATFSCQSIGTAIAAGPAEVADGARSLRSFPCGVGVIDEEQHDCEES